jgi:rhamnosyltransferase
LARGALVVVATIVLYHPDLAVLERLLTSLNGQVGRAIAVDNTPGSPAPLPAFFGRFPFPISYIPLGENKGIAEAQNFGIRESLNGGGSHVLLLDQDSTLPPNMIKKLLAAEGELLKLGKKVAAVGPRYVDEKTGIPSFAVRYGDLTVSKIRLDPDSSVPVETDILIASGSIIRAETVESVGMMRDDLFIDFVDTEWSLRARSMGYKSYCVPDAIMAHSVGDTAIKVFGRSVYLHSDVRKYYRLRNAIYLLRLSSMGRQWRSYIFRWIPYYFLLNIWISKNKLPNARLLLKALWDGVLGRLGPAPQYQEAPGLGSDKSGLSFEEGR